MMETKDLIVGDDVTKSLSEGVRKTIEAVGATLGPKGQNVLIDSGHPVAASLVTKDGVTVLRNLILNDPVEHLAVKMIREASEKTVEECGDGTTTTAILAGAIYTLGLKHLASGTNPVLIKRGIDKVVDKIVNALDDIKRDVVTDEDIRNVATISSNSDDDIGSLIVQAVEKVGKQGVITVENGKTRNDELETADGMKFDRGFVSPYFITNQVRGLAELKNPMILVTDHEFKSGKEIITLLELAVSVDKPLLIVSDGGNAESLQAMVVNKIQGAAKCCAVDAPGFGDRKIEYLKDIAVAVGATFVSEAGGITINQVTSEMMGTCERAVVTKNDTTFVDSNVNSEELKNRIDELASQLNDTDVDYDKEFLKERIAKLSGGIAVIRVGGSSETEVEEKKDRIDDALGATRAAIEGGIVMGGGCALLHAAQKIEMADLNISNREETVGVEIILEAIKSPLKCIVENAGKSGDYVAETIIQNAPTDDTFGYNATTEEYDDMYKMGIIDPVNVTKAGLLNATSVATLLLTSKNILMKPKKE